MNKAQNRAMTNIRPNDKTLPYHSPKGVDRIPCYVYKQHGI